MGVLSHFKIGEIKNTYECDCFVETGTYLGDAVELALVSGFNSAYSCELNPSFFAKATERFKSRSAATIISGDSVNFLKFVLPRLTDRKILFWLDAHLPEVYGFQPENKAIRFPLERELQTIREIRPAAKDVFLIDDLRIYMDGPFHHRNAPAEHKISGGEKPPGIGFINTLFDLTHNIELDFSHEGYIVITPKSE